MKSVIIILKLFQKLMQNELNQMHSKLWNDIRLALNLRMGVLSIYYNQEISAWVSLKTNK